MSNDVITPVYKNDHSTRQTVPKQGTRGTRETRKNSGSLLRMIVVMGVSLEIQRTFSAVSWPSLRVFKVDTRGTRQNERGATNLRWVNDISNANAKQKKESISFLVC